MPQDLVNDILRRPTRERLRLFVASLGTGLAGRPADIQAVLRRSWPGAARDAQDAAHPRATRTARSSSSSPTRTPSSPGWSRAKRDVTRFIRESRGAAETAASRRAELREGAPAARAFLAELRPTMAELSELARQGTPLAVELQRAAPDATTMLRRLGPFAEAPAPRCVPRATPRSCHASATRERQGARHAARPGT